MLSWRRENEMADPLILLAPGEQFPADLCIHPAIPPDRARAGKVSGGKIVS